MPNRNQLLVDRHYESLEVCHCSDTRLQLLRLLLFTGCSESCLIKMLQELVEQPQTACPELPFPLFHSVCVCVWGEVKKKYTTG